MVMDARRANYVYQVVWPPRTDRLRLGQDAFPNCGPNTANTNQTVVASTLTNGQVFEANVAWTSASTMSRSKRIPTDLRIVVDVLYASMMGNRR